jgi:hypothetical protein
VSTWTANVAAKRQADQPARDNFDRGALVGENVAPLENREAMTPKHLKQLGMREIPPIIVLANDRGRDNQRPVAVLADDLGEELALFFEGEFVQNFEQDDDIEPRKRDLRPKEIGGFESGVWKIARFGARNCDVRDVDADNTARVGEERLGQMPLAAAKLKDIAVPDEPAEMATQSSIAKRDSLEPPWIGRRVEYVEVCCYAHRQSQRNCAMGLAEKAAAAGRPTRQPAP